jgi:DNA-binding CsgD family transcriptional regulator
VLIGREPDCARLDELLARARRGRSGSLEIRGDAGIGKTSLLEYAIDRARDLTIVRALGVESEAELQYSGLLELLRPLLEHFPDLPPAQADALRSALGLGPPAALDRFTIGAATLNALAAAADERPLLVVVDDAQWLDGATRDALLFASKRLVADAVVLLFATRDDGSAASLPGIDQLLLGPLGPADARRLLDAAGGTSPSEEVAQRLWEATGGNPLALVEVRRLLSEAQLHGREPLPEPIPAGATLERAFLGRVERLPEESRQALVVAAVALAYEVELQTISAALATMGIEPAALEPAEDAGLIALAEGRLAFRHPLVRSAIFHCAAPSDRRAAHRALAHSLRDPNDLERRAWHLAGAAIGRDDEAAAALEELAEQAGARSGYMAAAAAYARAAELTAGEGARLRRLQAAAEAAQRGGRADEAVTYLAEPLAAGDPLLRVEALRLAARIDYLAARPASATALLLEAATLLEPIDPQRAIEILAERCVTQQILGDRAAVRATADRALELAALVDDERSKRLAEFTLGWVLCYAGEPEEGMPIVQETADTPWSTGEEIDPLALLRSAVTLDWLERSRDAFHDARRAIDRSRAEGSGGLLPYLLVQHAWHGVRAGLLDDGYAAASEALGLARELGIRLPEMQALLILTAATGRRGMERECVEYATAVVPLIETSGARTFRLWRLYSVGVLWLALGRYDDALRDLEQAAQGLEELGIHSPSFLPRAELAEIHVRAGREDEANEALSRFEASPEARSPLGLAAGARARGLLAANDAFEQRFHEALAAHVLSDDRWSLARTRLAFGERLRRAGRRVDAREQLRLALEAFEEMGADTWAARAQAELKASGETLRRRREGAGEQLTPQELQIALHVARGLTNKEVGAALFLSHKTVEFHLGRIFRKLGMRARAELIARYGTVARELEEATSVT